MATFGFKSCLRDVCFKDLDVVVATFHNYLSEELGSIYLLAMVNLISMTSFYSLHTSDRPRYVHEEENNRCIR